MSVTTYQNACAKNQRLSENFTASEFMCRCGTYCSAFSVDSALVKRLQELRGQTGKSVYVNSGYRCPTHNKNVGGASGSYHTKGMAADIRCEGLSLDLLAGRAESAGFKGIIQYPNRGFVHVDTRTSPYFAVDYGNGKITSVPTFCGALYPIPTRTLKKGSAGNDVKWVQDKLTGQGFDSGSTDGLFGAKTERAVRIFQATKKLTVDGIVGPNTRKALSQS